MNAIEMKLKKKHIQKDKPKFGGKKRGSGNSGGTGRVAKALSRSRVVHSRLKSTEAGKPNQYSLWKRAQENNAAE